MTNGKYPMCFGLGLVCDKPSPRVPGAKKLAARPACRASVRANRLEEPDVSGILRERPHNEGA